MELSVPLIVTSSSMVLGEEIIRSKVENAKEPNRSGVGSGLAENSSARLEVPAVSMGQGR